MGSIARAPGTPVKSYRKSMFSLSILRVEYEEDRVSSPGRKKQSSYSPLSMTKSSVSPVGIFSLVIHLFPTFGLRDQFPLTRK